MSNLPQQFIDRTTPILGDEMEQFVAALDTPPATSVRYNPFKLSSQPDAGKPVPWCRYGRQLDERPQFTLDPLLHAGVYYVQESSSMFVEHLLRSSVEQTEGLRLLDLCAAPGGKTTLYSTLVGLDGLVVANEVIRSRASVLAENVRKWGLGNVAVTNNDPAHFSGMEHYFDVVAIDAPCSGEGMFRKNPQAREEWSVDNVNLCAQRQRRIVSEVWQTLKPGGVMIYSTCTFNREENEDNVRWMVEEFGCEAVDVEVDPTWGVVKGDVEGINTFRFYPHRVSGEGFFATVVRKPEGRIRTRMPKARKQIFAQVTKQERAAIAEYFNQPEFMEFAKIGNMMYGYYSDVFADVKSLAESMTVIASGVVVGEIFGKKLKPEQALATFHDVNTDGVPTINLDLEQALSYLRKNDIPPNDMAEGLNLVCYNSTPIGWLKRIGNRTNNMYPKELRILM